MPPRPVTLIHSAIIGSNRPIIVHRDDCPKVKVLKDPVTYPHAKRTRGFMGCNYCRPWGTDWRTTPDR